MKNLLKITAATAALALGVSGANAAMLLHQDAETGNKVVINTETQSEAEVLEATSGQPPVDCPEGTFFITVDPNDQSEIVNACVTGEQWFVGQADDGTFAAQAIRRAPSCSARTRRPASRSGTRRPFRHSSSRWR
jgi:hypothetical protein